MASRPVRSVVIGGAVAAAALLAAPPAMAHEFEVVVVTGDTAEAADAGRGFRLAVDQSPDVSHPPEEAAGDHLGGVDVDIVSVQAGSPSSGDEVGARLDTGASAVVVMASGPSADAAVFAAVTRGKLVLVIDTTSSAKAARGQIVLRPDGRTDERRRARFAAAFTAASGSGPTDAATLGYDAGTLLDGVVRRLGEDLAPGADLDGATRAAADELVSARLDAVPDTPRTAPPAPDPRPSTDRRRVGLLLAAAVLIAGTATVAMHRRRHQ